MKPTKDYLFSTTSILIGIIIGLLVCEISLRLVVGFKMLPISERFTHFLNEQKQTTIYRRSKDPLLSLEFIPESQLNNIRINSGGFRGREYSKEVPKGVTRIAILGDSETFGVLLAESDTISGCLGRILNEISQDKKFEVLNFGFPGYNIIEESRTLETRAIHYNPSIVILYHVFNDPDRKTRPVLVGKTVLEKFLGKTYLYSFLRYWEVFKKRMPYELVDDNKDMVNIYQKSYNSEDFVFCKNSIRQMGHILHERNIRFIVLIAPEIIAFSNFNEYPYRDIHKKLLELSSKEIEVIDPLDSLISMKVKPRDLWVSPSNCHKNKKANEAIANTVAKNIVFDYKD